MAVSVLLGFLHGGWFPPEWVLQEAREETAGLHVTLLKSPSTSLPQHFIGQASYWGWPRFKGGELDSTAQQEEWQILCSYVSLICYTSWRFIMRTNAPKVSGKSCSKENCLTQHFTIWWWWYIKSGNSFLIENCLTCILLESSGQNGKVIDLGAQYYFLINKTFQRWKVEIASEFLVWGGTQIEPSAETISVDQETNCPNGESLDLTSDQSRFKFTT